MSSATSQTAISVRPSPSKSAARTRTPPYPSANTCRSHSPFDKRRYHEVPAISSNRPSPSTSAAAKSCSLTPVATLPTSGHGVTKGSSGTGTEKIVPASGFHTYSSSRPSPSISATMRSWIRLWGSSNTTRRVHRCVGSSGHSHQNTWLPRSLVPEIRSSFPFPVRSTRAVPTLMLGNESSIRCGAHAPWSVRPNQWSPSGLRVAMTNSCAPSPSRSPTTQSMRSAGPPS